MLFPVYSFSPATNINNNNSNTNIKQSFLCIDQRDGVFRVIPGIIQEITITLSYPLEHGDNIINIISIAV